MSSGFPAAKGLWPILESEAMTGKKHCTGLKNTAEKQSRGVNGWKQEQKLEINSRGNCCFPKELNTLLTSPLDGDDLRESVGLAWEINCGLLLYEA